jgi:hypothetical protein
MRRLWVRQGTFAGVSGNDEDAPEVVILIPKRA